MSDPSAALRALATRLKLMRLTGDAEDLDRIIARVDLLEIANRRMSRALDDIAADAMENAAMAERAHRLAQGNVVIFPRMRPLRGGDWIADEG